MCNKSFSRTFPTSKGGYTAKCNGPTSETSSHIDYDEEERAAWEYDNRDQNE